jgi:thiaminase
MEYGQDEVTEGVNQALDLIDAWATGADEDTLRKMEYYYLKAALYEYAFWDYGYYGDTKSYDYTESLEGWI